MDPGSLIGGCLTAPGEGGLHVFQVCGEDVPRLLGDVFRPTGHSSSSLQYGRLVDADRLVDEVVVVCDGASRVEISTHGGEGTRAAVVALLGRHGVRLVDPEALVSLVGDGATLRREARAGMARARTTEALLFHAAADSGALLSEVRSLRAGLSTGGDVRSAQRRLRLLLNRAPYGVAFGDPPTVLLAGPPNAGKSTLANRLAGSERCIVSDTPGTTRDLVAEDVSLCGYPFRMLDSAGLRATEDPVEKLGVDRTTSALAESSVVVMVLDGSAPSPEDPGWRATALRQRPLIALNKMDLGHDGATESAARETGLSVLPVSAREGAGVAALERAILFRSPFRGPADRDLPCPFTARQVRCLEAARDIMGSDRAAAVSLLTELLEGGV